MNEEDSEIIESRWVGPEEELEAERQLDEEEQREAEEREFLKEMTRMRALYDAEKASLPKNKCEDCGKPCESWLCKECCEHDEHEHGYCIECGANIMDDLVGRAEMARDAAEDR